MILTTHQKKVRINNLWDCEIDVMNRDITKHLFVLVDDKNNIVKTKYMLKHVACGLNAAIRKTCNTLSWEQVILSG